jgi:hypothetical protein
MAWVPDHPDFFSGLDSFTVELSVWFNNTGGFGERILISQWNEGTDQAWKLTWGSGFMDFRVSPNPTGSSSSVVGTAWAPADNTWYDVAVDFDGTVYRMYVDGVMIDTDNVSCFC